MIRNAKARDALGAELSPIWERLSDEWKERLIKEHDAAFLAANTLSMMPGLSPKARLDIIKNYGDGTLTEDDLTKAVTLEAKLRKNTPQEPRTVMHFAGLNLDPDSGHER